LMEPPMLVRVLDDGLIPWTQAVASHNFFWGEGTNFGGSSCFRYFAYRKLIAAKMVFVRFLWVKHKFGWVVAAPRPAWLRDCLGGNSCGVGHFHMWQSG